MPKLSIPLKFTFCAFLIIISGISTVFSDEEESSENTSTTPLPLINHQQDKTNTSIVLDKLSLPTPPGYRKWELPLHSTKPWRVYAFVSIFIRAVLEVDEKNEELVLDTDFGLQWVDWKIFENLEKTAPRKDGQIDFSHRTLDSDVLFHIWKPDVFIDEMSAAQRTSVLSKLITLNFLGGRDGGDIVYTARTTLKLRCDMSFQYYPADTQTCQYYLRSYSYNASKFNLQWNEVDQRHGVYLNDPTDPNFDLQVAMVEPLGDQKWYIEENFDDFRRGNYTALTFTIKARRKLSYHLVQTYLPSVLLILITWLCFLLPGELVEARIGISMTTVLTLTAMFAAVRQQSPEVSYTMAIDIWMVFCIFFVFLALLLFTVLYWITRRQHKKEKEALEHRAGYQADGVVYRVVMRIIKKYAFLAFAVVFLSFVIIYWSWLLLSSHYLSWNPSVQYNSAPESDGGDDFDDTSLYKYHFSDRDLYAEMAGEVTTEETTNPTEMTSLSENLMINVTEITATVNMTKVPDTRLLNFTGDETLMNLTTIVTTNMFDTFKMLNSTSTPEIAKVIETEASSEASLSPDLITENQTETTLGDNTENVNKSKTNHSTPPSNITALNATEGLPLNMTSPRKAKSNSTKKAIRFVSDDDTPLLNSTANSDVSNTTTNSNITLNTTSISGTMSNTTTIPPDSFYTISADNSTITDSLMSTTTIPDALKTNTSRIPEINLQNASGNLTKSLNQ